MRIVYLHGFSSGPRSAKALALEPILTPSGDTFEAPDLNVPSFERLSMTLMIESVIGLVRGGPAAVLVGSSLGALIALHVQARAPEVRGAVLLAPALEADTRWPAVVGGRAGVAAWRARGSRPFFHHAYGREVDLHVRFLDDLLAHARPPPLRVPAEVVHGLRDATVPPDVSRRFVARESKRARLALVDDEHGLLNSIGAIVAAIESAKDRGRDITHPRGGPGRA